MIVSLGQINLDKLFSELFKCNENKEKKMNWWYSTLNLMYHNMSLLLLKEILSFWVDPSVIELKDSTEYELNCIEISTKDWSFPNIKIYQANVRWPRRCSNSDEVEQILKDSGSSYYLEKSGQLLNWVVSIPLNYMMHKNWKKVIVMGSWMSDGHTFQRDVSHSELLENVCNHRLQDKYGIIWNDDLNLSKFLELYRYCLDDDAYTPYHLDDYRYKLDVFHNLTYVK